MPDKDTYSTRRHAGLCGACGLRPAEPHAIKCASCGELQRKHAWAWYHRHKLGESVTAADYAPLRTWKRGRHGQSAA